MLRSLLLILTVPVGSHAVRPFVSGTSAKNGCGGLQLQRLIGFSPHFSLG
jgi:hypothetical protein